MISRGCSFSDDPAVSHHDQPGALLRLLHVVRRDQHARSAVGRAADRLPEPGASKRINARGWFIQHQQIRMVRERLSERDPPLHAKRQRANELASEGLELIGQRRSPWPEDRVAELHVLCGAQVVIEAQALRHIANPAAGAP